jgi:two-component system chemotaxis response regulator CheY
MKSSGGNIKKIPVSDLKVGMFVHKVESPSMSTPFMLSDYQVASQTDIQTLIDYAMETVYIDTSRGLDVGQSLPNPQANKIRALVVDDSRIIRQIEVAVFKKIGGMEIDEAVDGADALAKLTKNKYDIVLLDWMMPKMTGEQVLREIRGVAGPNKDTPVLMVTAEMERKKILSVASLGISGYVTKQFTAESLEEKIRGVMDKKRVVLG